MAPGGARGARLSRARTLWLGPTTNDDDDEREGVPNMRIDLWVPTASPFTTAEVLATVGAEAEQRGVGTVWVGEHVVLFEEYASSYPYADDGRIPAPSGSGLLEPLNSLSFLAAHTTATRLGTAMVLLPQRNPVYTAKEASTLDWLSNGRVDFGVGVGGWRRSSTP